MEGSLFRGRNRKAVFDLRKDLRKERKGSTNRRKFIKEG
jgi:hypothetical protein